MRISDWSSDVCSSDLRLGERVAATARREVAEKAGIDIEVGPLIDVVDSISRDAEGAVQFHYTLVDLLAEWRAGEAQAGHDAAAAAWADPAERAPYGLWRETERVRPEERRGWEEWVRHGRSGGRTSPYKKKT